MRRFAIVVGLAMGACTSPQNLWVRYEPFGGVVPGDKAAAVQRVVVAITDAGGEIETSDAAGGLVVSKWFEAGGITTDFDRFRVRLVVSDDRSYELAALCEEKVPRSRPWERCTRHPGQLPRFVVDLLAACAAALR